MKNKGRYIEYDAIRAICVLYIVGFWHLNSYLPSHYSFSSAWLPLLHNLTTVVLGTFTFISGSLLSKYSFSSGLDIVVFFKKRFVRFFFILLFSAITYYLLKWISLAQTCQIVTGLNLIIGPSVTTLWFFSMIILFYLITPLIRYKYDSIITNILICIAIFLAFIYLTITGADRRLVLYFPAYVTGLCLPTEKAVQLIRNKLLLAVSIPMLCIQFIFSNWLAVQILLELFGIASFIVICGNLRFGFLKYLAVASMIAYLFHRQLGYEYILLPNALFEKQGCSGIPLWAACLGLLMLFVISYWGQIFYDRYFTRWIKFA